MNKGTWIIHGTRENTTPEDPGNLGAPELPPEDLNNPEGRSYFDNPDGSYDDNYLPPDDAKDILEAEDFMVPEDHEVQAGLKNQLIATAHSLEEKQQWLQAEEDTLNNRWLKVLTAEEGYGTE